MSDPRDLQSGSTDRQLGDVRTSARPHVRTTLLSIVMPVYREGEAARATIVATAAAAPRPYEMLVVHDQADDPTIPVVDDIRREFPDVRALHNQLGRGPALAIRAGFAAARGEAVLVTMADASDEPHLIAPMLEKIEQGYDLVAASRYMPGGQQIGGPPLKTFLSRLAGRSLHMVVGVATNDATSSFKMYRRSMVEHLGIESAHGFELAIELTVKAHLAGYRITEIPTTWRDREAGESNFRLFRWLPRYLRWYGLAFRHGLARRAPYAASAKTPSTTKGTKAFDHEGHEERP